jgi:hypothetical protein
MQATQMEGSFPSSIGDKKGLTRDVLLYESHIELQMELTHW